MYPEPSPRQQNGFFTQTNLVIIGVAVVVIGALAAYLIGSSGGDSDSSDVAASLTTTTPSDGGFGSADSPASSTPDPTNVPTSAATTSANTAAPTTEADPFAAGGELTSTSTSEATTSGEPLEQTILVTELHRTDSNIQYDEDRLHVNGEIFTESPQFSFYGDGSGSVSYDLGRHFTEFEAHVGFDDRSESSDPLRVSIIREETGEVLWQTDMGLGDGEDVILDVTDVLRLTLKAETLSSPGKYRTVGFGHAQVTGTPPPEFLDDAN